MKQVITLSDNAANRIKEIMSKAEKNLVGLRVGVKSGGCAGMSYMMEYTKEVVNQYFETDLDNCLLTQTDFCNIIADILDEPQWLKDEIIEYFKIRESEVE